MEWVREKKVRKVRARVKERVKAKAREKEKGKAMVRATAMMKVVGEEGTSLNDFIVYLKGEFVDAVYLQQNAFDKVDAPTTEVRQKYVFHLIYEILETEFSFDSKDAARKFFQSLRQKFIEWNSIEWLAEDFKQKEKGIRAEVAEKAKQGER